MPYTANNGKRVDKGETRLVSRSFDGPVNADGELVVSIPELVSADNVVGTELTSVGDTAVDPPKQFDDGTANAAVGGTVDATESQIATSGIADNEVVLRGIDLGTASTAAAELADPTNIQGTVYVEGE